MDVFGVFFAQLHLPPRPPPSIRGASRGLDLDLDDSPIFPHVPKKKAASKATSKATKPKAMVAKGDSSTNGRAGRAAGRARKPSATGAAGREKSVLTGSREVSVDDPATTSVVSLSDGRRSFFLASAV